MNTARPQQTLTFKPRARLIRTIGDRLIRGPETAVIELIKNSHDADASYVRITFEPPLTEGDGAIIVEDDGHGMTLTEIEERWMEPATTDKIDRRNSPNGRTLLGSKGIGRFATARLGRWLELETTGRSPHNPKSLETTKILNIDWDVFDETKYLSEITFDYIQPMPSAKTGTCLKITGVSENWTEVRLGNLHKEIRRLISPLEEADRADFKIFLDLSKYTNDNCGFNGTEIVNGPLLDVKDRENLHRVLPYPLLNSCDYEVEGEFDSEGKFCGTITIHRGELVD